MMSHADVAELLGAYALDAVDPDEAAGIEEHLESCPRCRDELRSHREVVGVLAYSGQQAPDGLWDRVAAGINRPDDSEPLPSLRLVHAGRPGPTGRETPPKNKRRGAAFMALAAAAAVVVIALLGVEVARLQNRTDHLSGEVSAMTGQPTMAAVQRALRTPGAQEVALRPTAGGQVDLAAVILPGGQGYLYGSRLDPLSSSSTYQLWGVVGGQRISYGVLGTNPAGVTAFRASRGVSALAVTTEVAGGVVVSDHSPVALGVVG